MPSVRENLGGTGEMFRNGRGRGRSLGLRGGAGGGDSLIHRHRRRGRRAGGFQRRGFRGQSGLETWNGERTG